MIYDVGDEDRTIFFLVNGFVKVGAIMATGHEVICDVRKGGNIVGELCASEPVRVWTTLSEEQLMADMNEASLNAPF